MIDRTTIERIKDTADIVDVVSEFVSLKKVGANYRGLCPFHNDHTPSFYVSPSRRTCHCFVCGEGGDSVGFIMKHEQMTYPDALRWLANRYNIEIEERQLTEEQKREQSEREAMFIVNEWAAGYFKDILEKDIDGRAIGMQYFRQRGIRDDIMQRFRLGFCLNDRQAMSKAAVAKGYKEEYLIKTGLCYRKDNGELADRFAGRAIFPWIGVSGKVVAFGGRVLDARTKGVNQKYVNSPDSDVYHKDRELYGIFQAKKAIARENCVYMVEGYTDVISMHQCGIENVVANSGTALSEYQVHILHRFTANIVLLYDGDEAGIKAALRGTDTLLKEGMNVKVLLLPDGDDPDSFAKKHNAEEFRKYIFEHQTDFIEFKTKVLLEGVEDPVKRSEAISSIIKSVSVIGDPIIRATYIQACASRLGIQEQILIAKMNDNIREYRSEQRKEEERKRRNSSAMPQNFNSTGQQPTSAKQVRGGNDSIGDDGNMPPPDAFLPPEAFSKPQPSETQTAETERRSDAATSTTNKVKETVSDLIIKNVIIHGHEILYDKVETEDGNMTSLTLAEVISYDLAADNLTFSLPIYNRILKEAVSHSHEEGFNAEQYFTLHPEYEISSIAIRLTANDVFLSKSLQIKHTEEALRDKVIHLLLDFRYEYITAKLARLRTDIALAAGDAHRQKELMTELQQMQKVRSAVAKKIGSSITIR